MPDLLLELFCEEIPARMQARAAEDLKRLVTDGLVEAGLTYEGARALVTPRRLALTVQGVTARSREVREERKGPRVGAPEAAIQGFLRAAGLSSVEEAEVRSEPKKGEFYVATVTKPGRPAEEIVANLIPEVVRGFPWPKSMRWGARSAPPGTPFSPPEAEGTAAIRWVRPLRSILCTFGPETEEPEVVRFEVGGVASGDLTYGHRFLSTGPIRVKRFEDYASKLQAAYVVADPERRRDIIETEARNLAFAQNLELVEDAALLDEVAGLVEWPVVLMGGFDAAFLSIPQEVIRLTIRNNQKCFVTRRGGDGESALANRFILVSNIEAVDGGAAIVAGNQRVVAARLSDARFFWEQDRKIPLEEQARKLASIVFHEKLGTQAERVERIARLSRELAPIVGADPIEAERAARLAKADLVSGMVGEFPELQGVMGRYYAEAQGEEPAIADAIRDHYRPQGPNDVVPTEPVAIAVALADRLDMLVGFWAIDEKPTGSKDPYGLRRAALGVIRIVLENGVRLSLLDSIASGVGSFLTLAGNRLDRLDEFDRRHERHVPSEDDIRFLMEDKLLETLLNFDGQFKVENWDTMERSGVASVRYRRFFYIALDSNPEMRRDWFGNFDTSTSLGRQDFDNLQEDISSAYTLKNEIAARIDSAILSFFADRLKVHLREEGARHDLIDAIFALPGQDDLLMIVRRVEALGKLLDTEDGKNLLVGYRRAANILRVEEKKDGRAYDEPPDAALIHARGQAEERALLAIIESVEAHVEKHLLQEDFEGAMRSLAELRPAVDSFFDRVTVNTDDPALRENRLRLLNRIRQAMHKVADFSRIAG